MSILKFVVYYSNSAPPVASIAHAAKRFMPTTTRIPKITIPNKRNVPIIPRIMPVLVVVFSDSEIIPSLIFFRSFLPIIQAGIPPSGPKSVILKIPKTRIKVPAFLLNALQLQYLIFRDYPFGYLF